MQNPVMQDALAKAGIIAVPTISQRVWRWVKDHPDSTVDAVAHALGVGRLTASTALFKHVKCGSMSSTKGLEFHPKLGRKNPITRFRAVGDTYTPPPVGRPAGIPQPPRKKPAPTEKSLQATVAVLKDVKAARATETVEAPSIASVMAQIEQMRFIDVLELRKLINARFGD